MESTPRPLLEIQNLAVSFPVRLDKPDARGRMRPTLRRVRAVNGVSLSIFPKQTLAVVGESGCGKSLTALSTLRLVPTPPGQYDSGRILWSSSGKGQRVDLLQHTEQQMRKVRGGQIAMIFQEPMTSLNPVYTIGEQILEAILLHQQVTQAQAIDIAAAALRDVGIADPRSRLREYPHQLSGGMRQRVMIAMALACKPELLLADEPTTALDVTIQAQILELLRRLQHEHGMAIMLITHDLGVVAENADVVAVMYAGRVVEYGTVHDVFRDPLHPYTRGLFASMPVLGQERHRLEVIEGQVPSVSSDALQRAVDIEGRLTSEVVAADPMVADVIDLEGRPTRVFRRTVDEQPALREVRPGHWVACHATAGHASAAGTPPSLTHVRALVP